MREAHTYRGARRNWWHEKRSRTGHRWDESGLRFDVHWKQGRAAPVRPNRSRHLEHWPTLRELAKRKAAA